MGFCTYSAMSSISLSYGMLDGVTGADEYARRPAKRKLDCLGAGAKAEEADADDVCSSADERTATERVWGRSTREARRRLRVAEDMAVSGV